MTSKNTSRARKRSDEAVYAHEYLAELQDLALAAQIRVLREQRGWSQQELADRAGMAQARVSLLESADYTGRTLSTLRKIAQAFDVGLSVSFDPYFREIRRIESGSAEFLRVPSRADEHNLGTSSTHTSVMKFPGGRQISSQIGVGANTGGVSVHNLLPSNFA